MKECIILLGHGSPRKDANNLEKIGAMLHGMLHPRCPDDCVRAAYLQFAEPGIMDAIKACVDRGARRIILPPFFLSAGIHVTRDIPALIEQARALYPEVTFLYTEPLGLHEKLAEIMMERISAAENLSPEEIEKRSFAILSVEADLSGVPAEHLPIVQRVIHATADFEFKNTLLFHRDAVRRGVEAIRAGRDILTDVEMVKTGINKRRLAPWGGKVICGLQNPGPEVTGAASSTRTERGIESALRDNPNIGIIAVGNAPTALLKTIALLAGPERTGNATPLVVGVPVGFVKAVESKALLAEQAFPFITALGRKGGTPVAVAIVNALLKIADGGDGI